MPLLSVTVKRLLKATILSMKLAIFTDTYCDANGVSRFLQDMNRCAFEKAKKIKIFTSTTKSHCRYTKNLFNPKPLLQIPMPFYPDLSLTMPPYSKLKSEFLEFGPDIVHISTPGPIGFYGKSVAKEQNLPVAGTYHTDFPAYLYKNMKLSAIEKVTYKVMQNFYSDFSLIFTRSSLYLPIVTKKVKVKPSKVKVLRAGTDTQKFNPKHKTLYDWSRFLLPREGLKFLYVGRLTKEKNFRFLLEVWREFRKNSSVKASLVIVGSGSEEKLALEFARYGVYYLGHKDGKELSFLYAASDIFISASTTETLGQTLLEAIASGTPVIVSNIGGHLDFVTPSCGVIVNKMKIEDWVEALNFLSQNQTACKKASQEALKIASELSIEKSFEDFYIEHESLLKKERSYR